MNIDEVIDELAEECEDDHVGLWEVVTAARLDLGMTSPEEVRAVTLRLVRALLSDKGVRAGFPTPDGRHFVPWPMTPTQVLGRIEEEWDRLGRAPHLGEIVWFNTPEHQVPQ